jgi:predicted NUDIX family NTP pyrophosphohydrolase
LLVYRREGGQLRVFLVHPGGPFWAKKDAGAWSIPKGEFTPDENPLAAARREFTEETGQFVDGRFLALTPCRQPGGKVVHAFAVEADVDAGNILSNQCEIEFPPRSGKRILIPEVDRAGWFTLDDARDKILKGQRPMLDELVSVVGKD